MNKRVFTSFDVAAVVRELKESILDARVNNVYQLEIKTLLFKLHKTDKPAFRLILEAGKRLHLTAYTAEKPQVPPAFCMGLRKYLRNSRLVELDQNEFERVVILSFKTNAGIVKLILELFGEGNIILTGENGKILQALLYKRMRDRSILRGEAFKFAPPSGKNPQKLDVRTFVDGLKAYEDVEIVRAVARFLSVGGMYAEETVLRAGIDKKTICSALGEIQIRAVLNVVQALVSQATTGRLEPCIVYDSDGNFVDVVPIRLEQYGGGNFKLQSYRSFNEALDEFYTKVLAIESVMANTEVDKLKEEAERLKRIIAVQEKTLAEAEAKAEKNRLIGDKIYAHSHRLQTLLDKLSGGKQKGKNLKTIVSEILAEKEVGTKSSVCLESFDPKEKVANFRVNNLSFNLSLRKTLFENASGFYERGKREKQRLEGTKTALEESRDKLAQLEVEIREAEASEIIKPAKAMEQIETRKVKSKEWYEKFRWFMSSDGFLVVAGRDAVSNEVLIKKYADKNDIVFHADIVGAPFVVVKTAGKNPSDRCLSEAGEFAAALSRGWREGFGSIDVFWVRPEQLSKGGHSGEYVAHGAFMVRGERNWQRGIALKLAIGAVVDGDSMRLMGGPVDAVKDKTNILVTVAPGDSSGKELLKKILTSLSRKAPKQVRENILRSSIEEIRNFVPFGRGTIIEN